jgi:hypothetical protein
MDQNRKRLWGFAKASLSLGGTPEAAGTDLRLAQSVGRELLDAGAEKVRDARPARVILDKAFGIQSVGVDRRSQTPPEHPNILVGVVPCRRPRRCVPARRCKGIVSKTAETTSLLACLRS